MKDALLLPEGRAGAAAVAAPTGVMLVGGENADGPVATVWKSPLADDGTLQPWEPEASLVHPQADGAAWIDRRLRLAVGRSRCQRPGRGGPARDHRPGRGRGPARKTRTRARSSSGPSAIPPTCPAARDNAATWSANGTIYLVGGEDGTRPAGRALLDRSRRPRATSPVGSTSTQSDLPFGLTGGAAVVSGPNAIIVGGETTEGVTSSSARANVAPLSPFFQLGLAGATIPGLKIEGEIGQQLGYLNAAGAGTVNFIILLLIGWGFAHKEQARAMIRRVLRR